MKDTLLLIDANSLIHRAYHALPPFTAPDGRATGALYGLSSILIKILKEGLPDNGLPNHIIAAFDRPEPTFRKKEYKEYKITRPKAPDDLIEQIIEAHNIFDIFNIKVFEFPGWEADDIIMAFVEMFRNDKLDRIIILSGDLDMLQAVHNNKVVVLTPQKGISNTVLYNEEAVFKRFGVYPHNFADYKGLVGDRSDNIPGVPGIGPKTAAELIKNHGSLEGVYKEIEEGVGLSNIKLQEKLINNKDQAILSKKLATLNTDMELVVNLEDVKMPPLDKGKIANYFNKLGFSSLVNRIEAL